METARIRDLALELCSFDTVTDSEGERRFGPFLRDKLALWPRFVAHPEHLRILPTLDDDRERYIVFALAKGRETKTLVLTGHYDVVETSAYGTLESCAFEPEVLGPRLISALRGEVGAGGGESLARALHDLESGEFLAGRGLLDMKAGLAAGLALLEEYGGQTPGSILFVAVPDEEGSSSGMKSAVRHLPSLCREWGIEPIGAVNLDASIDQGDGSIGRAVFLGSVGKLHPFVLFIGRPSHAGSPFDGINAALLSSEFVRRIECSPGALGSVPSPGGDAPPPPTVLYNRDLRECYDVTTPRHVFVSVNVLVHERSPAEVLDEVSRKARAAMGSAMALLRGRAAAREPRGSFAPPDQAPRVIGWAELSHSAAAADEKAFSAAMEVAQGATRGGDRILATARLVAAATAIAGIEGPAAVVGLAPPYYPRAALRSEKDLSFEAALRRAAARISSSAGESIAIRPFFPGISDMSHMNPIEPEAAFSYAESEAPLGLGWRRPRAEAQDGIFRCPVANIGPWGRDYHQRLERVHASYAFKILPEILRAVAEETIGARGPPCAGGPGAA